MRLILAWFTSSETVCKDRVTHTSASKDFYFHFHSLEGPFDTTDQVGGGIVELMDERQKSRNWQE